jgi:hypothetical protein
MAVWSNSSMGCGKCVTGFFPRIRQIEEDNDGGRAERVKRFSETKWELEDRVANLTEQFSKLVTIRKDIAGLFDKMGSK